MEEQVSVVEDKNTAKITKCLNCGTEFQGKFCPECGQRADTSRFTIKFIFENLLKAILSNDGGVWITLKSLFTHPGQMMVDIISGKRKSYFSPFPMLFLTLSLYVVIFTFTGSKKNDYDEVLSGNDTEIVKDNNTDSAPDTNNETDASASKQYSFNVQLNEDMSNDLESMAVRCMKFYDNNYTIVFILTIPFYIFSARVCYGKKNRKTYNRGEYCIPIIYSLIIVVLYRCLTSIAFYFSKPVYNFMDDLNVIVTIIAFTACFKKMIGFTVTKMVWRSFLVHVLYYTIVVLIICVVAISYVSYLYLT